MFKQNAQGERIIFSQQNCGVFVLWHDVYFARAVEKEGPFVSVPPSGSQHDKHSVNSLCEGHPDNFGVVCQEIVE